MRQFSILVVVIVFFLCGPSKSLAQDKIVSPVTYSATNANMLSLWIAKDAGYFAEQGLDVRMLLIRALAKYVRTSDQEAIRTALEHQIKILPDIPYPFEDGIKNILEDLARSNPEAKNIAPSALMDISVVRDAAKGL